MDEDLIAAVRRASEVIRETGLDENSPIGVAAFQAVLSRVLAPVSQEPRVPRERQSTHAQETSDDPAGTAAAWADVDIQVLRDFIIFGEEGVRIEVPARLLSNRRAELQRQLALLKLALDRAAYDREEVPASELAATCQQYGCLDQNMPRNIVAYQNHVLRRGVGRASTYRLTQQGRDAGRELVREILSAA